MKIGDTVLIHSSRGGFMGRHPYFYPGKIVKFNKVTASVELYTRLKEPSGVIRRVNYDRLEVVSLDSVEYGFEAWDRKQPNS